MTLERTECIFVEPRAGHTTTTVEKSRGELLDSALPSERLRQITRALLQAFDRVHICSSPRETLRVLDSRSKYDPPATYVLVSLDGTTTEADGEFSDVQERSLDTIWLAPNETPEDAIDDLTGLKLLRHLSLLKNRRKLDFLMTAACFVQLDSAQMKAAYNLGVDEFVLSPPSATDVQRLALTLYKNYHTRQPRRPLSDAEDTSRYERAELSPTPIQWTSLQTRVHATYLNNSYEAHKDSMLKDHLPSNQAPRVYDTTFFTSPRHSAEVARLQKLVSGWSFCAFDLDETELVNCAAVIFRHIMDLPGAESWRLDDVELYAFLDTMRRSYYTNNPYHNFRHAIDVTQAVFFMLLNAAEIPTMNGECSSYSRIDCPILDGLLSVEYILAACIVGIGHDVGHPGVNNAFLVTTKTPLAILYNDRSVLENLHCVALSRVLSVMWPATQQGGMRRIILEMILSTDMALHFDYMSRFKDMETLCLSTREANKDPILTQEPHEIPPATMEKHRLTLFSAIIKCADISNVARPFEISRLWSDVLLREFFNQARLEKSLDLPVTKNFDPNETRQADSQIFFMTLFAHPLFSSLETILPNLSIMSATIKQNRNIWKNGGVPPVRQSSPTDLHEQTSHSTETAVRSAPVSIDTKSPPPERMSPVTTATASPTKKAFCLPQFLKRKNKETKQ